MNPRWTGLAKISSVFLRLALGISFLSAVADRFGIWGAYGQPNVSWGNFGLLLVLGWKTRVTALLSGVLLTTFALTMTMALGVKAVCPFLFHPIQN